MAACAVLLVIARTVSRTPDCPMMGSKWDSSNPNQRGATERPHLMGLPTGDQALMSGEVP